MLTKPKEEHFLGALKRLRPIQRPAGWVSNPTAQIAEVLSKPYVPMALQEVVLPTGRQLLVPPTHDRIVQGALQLLLLPKVHAKRSQQPGTMGIQKVELELKEYLTNNPAGEFLKTDIKSFFGEVSQEAIISEVQQLEVSDWALDAIKCVIETSPKGIPQGSPLSPILADLAMVGLDQEIADKVKEGMYIRYVDDILLLGDKTTIEKYTAIINPYLAAKGLRLNASKTQRGDYPDMGFTLLGKKYFTKADINILLEVEGGSSAYGFAPFPNENPETRSIVSSGASRQESPKNITYSKEHFLTTLLDKPHPDMLELLISPQPISSTDWGSEIRKDKNKLLHIGYGKALHDFAFKTYVGKVKPAHATGKPIPLKQAAAVMRSLILGNLLLKGGEFPSTLQLQPFAKAYEQELKDLAAGNYQPFHTTISKLFKENYRLRQLPPKLPAEMPYMQDALDGTDINI